MLNAVKRLVSSLYYKGIGMKLNLPDITSINNIAAINSNFSAIEQELQSKVLYRDNPSSEPNALANDIDADGNAIYNVSTLRTTDLYIDGKRITPVGVLIVESNTDISGLMVKASNLSDVQSVPTSRVNLGLGNVNNTSDANKPISTATSSALATKQTTLVSATNIKTINGNSVLGSGDLILTGVGETNTTSNLGSGIGIALPKDGVNLPFKGLVAGTNVSLVPSSDSITINAVVDTSTLLVKSANLSDVQSSGSSRVNLGLGNVDNTSDLNKPISTPTTSALAGKQATLVSNTNIKTINGNSVLGSGNLAIVAAQYEIYVASFAGADPTGLTSSSVAFSLAQAAAGATGQVKVSKGTWNLAVDTPSCNWLVDAGASFLSTGKLVGTVNYTGRFDTFPTPKQGVYFGRPIDPLIGVGHYNDIPSAIRGISPYACTGVLGGSQSLDNPIIGAMGCIGVTAMSNNNNTSYRQYSYGMYVEAHRSAGAGSTLGVEIDVANHGSTEQITPNGWSFGAGGVMDVTAMLWLASGGDVVGVNDVSCAVAIIPNGAKSAKGIVFLNNSVASDSAPNGGIEYDAMSMPMQYSLNWWDGGNIKRVSIRGELGTGTGLLVLDGALSLQSQPTSTSASAGPYVLPATCSGFINVVIGGSTVKMPFFG